MAGDARPLPLLTLGLALAATALGVALHAGWGFAIDAPFDGPLGAVRLEAGGGVAGAFLLLVGVLGAAAAVAGRREHLDRLGRALVFLFILGLVAVPLAGDVFSLVLAWELMSASPGVLLLLGARAEVRRAGRLYLTYSQISAMALLLGLLAWSRGSGALLTDLASTAPPLAALLLILLAAAVKAGIMPFHAWLPEAHPAAPSHVSALMSGAMVVMPSYIVVRLLLPWGAPSQLATLVLLAGAGSAALASLHALHLRDMKRVLAMTTVAHMGVLFALLGLGLRFASDATLSAAVAATVAAYAFAHGLAKGALFLVSGEVHHATGELDLERLGGLWRASGRLALVAGLAGLALAALPPFGGLVAEISVFTTLFAALTQLDVLEGVIVFGALFLLGVGAGAGLAAVAKIVLGPFLGPARTPITPVHLPLSAVAPIAALLVASLAIGVAPGLLWSGLPGGAPDAWTLPTLAGPVVLAPFLVLALSLALALALAVRLLPRPERTPPWACGGAPPAVRETYTPQGLVMPFRILFAEILRPASDLRLQDAPVAPFAPHKGQYEDPQPRFLEPWVHEPIDRFLAPRIDRLRRLHRGPVQTYLIIGLLVLVLLLFLLPVIP